MRSITKGVIATLSAGLVVASLAACSEPASSGTSSSTSVASTSAPAPTTAAAAATPTPLATIPKLTGVHTQITLDAGFLKALTTLKLTPGTVGTATLKGAVISFPITGGNVKYFDPTQKYRPYVQGEIDHDSSGLSLTAGKTVVKLTDFVVHPGSGSTVTGEVLLNGKVAVPSATLFRLDGSTLKPLSKDSDGNAVLEGTKVYISTDAAALLNKVFKTTAVTDQLLVGVAKITAK